MAILCGISFRHFPNWLQEPLTIFKPVARLKAVVSTHGFRKRLRMPNMSLQGKPPLTLMASDDRELVADQVDALRSRSTFESTATACKP